MRSLGNCRSTFVIELGNFVKSWTEAESKIPQKYDFNALPSSISAMTEVNVFVWPSLGFRCSRSILYTNNLCLILLKLTFLIQVVLSASLSRLLPLQLGFERFQHISLS